MGIAFGSIGTGLPKDIVQQIMKAERIPVEQMKDRKNNIAEKKKLVDELINLSKEARKALNENSTRRSLRELMAEANDDLVSINVDKNVAQPGVYQLEIVQLAQKSSAMTSGFPSRNQSNTGVGFIKYYLPNGKTREVYIDSDNATLDGIAKIINSDEGNGLRANVVNDGSGSDNPWRIILSLDDTGDHRKAKFPHLYFVDGVRDLYLEFEREAHDAKIKLDGFEVEVSENSAKDLIPGVTIDLKKSSPGEEFPLKISEDVGSISVKIEKIVNSINEILKFISEQNNVDESTDTTKTLGGDILLHTISNGLQNAIFKHVKTSMGTRRLGDIGILFQRDGTLGLDKNKLESTLSKDYIATAELLVGYYSTDQKKQINGAINNLVSTFNNMLSIPNGSMASSQSALRSKINMIDSRIESREQSLEKRENHLKDKYARLEETMARIKTQGAGLTAISGKANDIITQLG